MKKLLAAVLLVLASASFAYAADGKSFATKEEAKALLDGAMQMITTDKVDEAFGSIEPYFPLEATELAAMKSQMAQQRALMKPRFGSSLGFVYYGEEDLQDLFVKFTYIEKFEKHAIQWSFVIYKPKDRWIVNSVFFDDKVLELLRR